MKANNEDFDDFIGYVAMVNAKDAKLASKGGCLGVVLALAALLVCIVSNSFTQAR